MKTSNKGLLELAELEGIVPAPYLCSAGIWTFGVGHTSNAGGLDPAKMPRAMPANLDAALKQAIQMLKEDVPKFEARINKHIKVPLAQHQFDALLLFDYNTGGIYYRSKSGEMKNALLVNAINRGDPNASDHFYGWVKPPELRNRRRQEKRIFDTGEYDANGDRIPIWKTNGQGKLVGRLQTMPGDELLRLMGERAVASIPAWKNESQSPAQPSPASPAIASGFLAWLIRFLKGK